MIYPAIGGAFGGREDMSVQIVLALAAWRLDQAGIRRPVKTVWSREESIIGHCKRHPTWLRCKLLHAPCTQPSPPSARTRK